MRTLLIKNYAVGQGGMALIQLANGDRVDFNLVYDCGVNKGAGGNMPESLLALERDLRGSPID